MFKIGKLFHLTHVVSDLDAVDKWYDGVFSCTRFYRGYEKLAGRDASLLVVGDVLMEPMQPAKVENLQNQSVKKFHDRFGQHFHSIAWYVDDVEEISKKLDQNGLRLFNITGRTVKPPHKQFAVWTHPKETHGQLEFALAGNYTIDPRLQPAWSNAFWRDQHPLGLERPSHLTVLVRDLLAARKFYCDVLEGKLFHEAETASKKSAFVAVGEDTVVELAQPTSTTSGEAQDMERNGEGVYALTYKTRNLAKAVDFLKSKSQTPAPDGDGAVMLGKDQAFGMVVRFSERALPGDPR